MKIAKNYICRDVSGMHLCMAVGQPAGAQNSILRLNDSGLLLYNALQKDTTVEELVSLLTQTYDVTPEAAASDISAFMEKLRKIGALQE